MIIVALSDIHGDVASIRALAEELAAADLVLLAGDLTAFGGRAAAEQVVGAVRAANSRVLAVRGNCDTAEADAYLSHEGINLHGRHEELGRLSFVGVGGSLPCPGATPGEFSDDELARFLEQAASGLSPHTSVVLVSHEPPCNTCTDLAYSGEHVGSRAVRRFIEQREPLVCFTAHVHEGRGIDAIGPTRVINPGPVRTGSFAYAEVDAAVRTLEIRARRTGRPAPRKRLH